MRIMKMRPPLLALLVLLQLSFLPYSVLGQTFERSELVIETASGAEYRFDVELAETPAQQAQGLMFRENLASDAGMLFLFREDRRASFWMKNTLIPLDMLFIHRDGRIESIQRNTEPLSTRSVSSEGPVAAVLEINGGLSSRLGIRPGDRVRHPAFGT